MTALTRKVKHRQEKSEAVIMIRKIKNSTFNAIPNIRYLGHVWIIAVLSGYATVSTAQAATFCRTG